MSIRNKTTVAITFLALLAVAGTARSTVIIDDFTVAGDGGGSYPPSNMALVASKAANQFYSPNPKTVSDGGLSTDHVIGGARNLAAEGVLATGPGGTITAYVDAMAADFQSSRSTSVSGVSRILWDGQADGVFPEYDPAHFAPGLDVNLAAHGEDRFKVVVVSDDLGGNNDIKVWDTFGHSADYFFATTSTLTPVTYYALFSDAAFAGIDFTHIAAIELQVGHGVQLNRDAAINLIATVSIPEPPTVALLSLGLVGMGLFRRRQAG